MRPVRAGRLKHRVTLEDYPFGSLTQAEQVQADVTHKITMRYAPGLAPKMRIRWGARVFEILFVGNVEEVRRMTEVLCKEVV